MVILLIRLILLMWLSHLEEKIKTRTLLKVKQESFQLKSLNLSNLNPQEVKLSTLCLNLHPPLQQQVHKKIRHKSLLSQLSLLDSNNHNSIVFFPRPVEIRRPNDMVDLSHQNKTVHQAKRIRKTKQYNLSKQVLNQHAAQCRSKKDLWSQILQNIKIKRKRKRKINPKIKLVLVINLNRYLIRNHSSKPQFLKILIVVL